MYVATTGIPAAIDSMITLGSPSQSDVRTKTSKIFIISFVSFRQPVRITFFSRFNFLISFSIFFRKTPSPTSMNFASGFSLHTNFAVFIKSSGAFCFLKQAIIPTTLSFIIANSFFFFSTSIFI